MKKNKEWTDIYSEKELKVREAVETIVSNMSRDDMMYYCYTIISGAGDTRFRYFCTHVIFDDDNLNINESDVKWILKGNSGICRSGGNDSNTYINGIDYAFLLFVVIMTHLHLKDIIKLYLLVNTGYLSNALDGQNINEIDLQKICEIYKEHRISKEARELIQNNVTHRYIAKELIDELEDIDLRGGFNNDDDIDEIVSGIYRYNL
jgi:hypothetical protein